MIKRLLLFLAAALLLLGSACTPEQVSGLQTMVAAVPQPQDGPLGGQVAALPTPDPNAATATPWVSAVMIPTEGPPIAGPLATLTAVAGMIPTRDTNATPYAVTLQGRPHFIEFHAWW